MKHRCKYEYRHTYGSAEHVWTCIGRHGAMHFHVTDMGEKSAAAHGFKRYSGGLEIHYRSPPAYMADDVPSQDRCWLLHCPCWHDGTSTYASEFLIPFWRANPDDHERMFALLIKEYDQRFASEPTP